MSAGAAITLAPHVQTFLAFDFGLKRTGVASGNRLTRTATPQTSITANTSGGSPVHVGLVGYLSGDVDGSFAGAAAALDLDDLRSGYFTSLAAASGLNLTQFGVYGA